MVSRVRHAPASVAGLNALDAPQLHEHRFQAPEAAASQRRDFSLRCPLFGHRFTFPGTSDATRSTRAAFDGATDLSLAARASEILSGRYSDSLCLFRGWASRSRAHRDTLALGA